VAATAIGSGSAAAVLFLVLQESAFDRLLFLDHGPHSVDETVLVSWTILATTVCLLLPVVLVCGVLIMAHRRSAVGIAFVAGHTLVLTTIALDLVIFGTFGLHLRTLASFAALPQGSVVTGSFVQWLWLVSVWTAALGAASFAAWVVVCRVLETVMRRASSPMRTFVAATAAFVLLLTASAPFVTSDAWSSGPLRERVHATLIADLRPKASSGATEPMGDPVLDLLQEGLLAAWKDAFPVVLAHKPTSSTAIQARFKPNVVMIAVESFRPDVLNAELMPRLHAWSRKGLRAPSHHAGSTYSEAGLFSLLYGRSPLVFHATLDGGAPPTACEIFRRSGYETAYYTGHPKVWMRRELYINERTFDTFARDDQGNWYDWDRKALATAAARANQTDGKPVFALVFLMSSHFEYRYPPSYERHLPVDRESTWAASRMVSLGARAREGLWNRYRNAMGFLDDAIADTIDSLDPARTIIVLTGDHGESIHDDGRFGHGYAFSDIVVRVPFVIAGPGVVPGDLDGITLHADVLPTLLHAIEGREVEFEHRHGRDLLVPQGPRRGTLLCHADVNQRHATALLMAGGRRVSMTLDLRAPNVVLGGFEDDQARLIGSHGASSGEARALIRAFREEMEICRR
jgi:membrane-anchored protein YejM (alkaline phosphatase superfamily)